MTALILCRCPNNFADLSKQNYFFFLDLRKKKNYRVNFVSHVHVGYGNILMLVLDDNKQKKQKENILRVKFFRLAR